MDPKQIALTFIKENFDKYGIEWINKKRVSEDFKFLIFGLPNKGKQIGIYGRSKTIIRIENYNQDFDGVTKLTKCAKSAASEASFSNFKNQKGVCVEVKNIKALEKLLDWYFNILPDGRLNRLTDTNPVNTLNVKDKLTIAERKQEIRKNM
jgi:hypothetical protein